jgi:hypothetical protein
VYVCVSACRIVASTVQAALDLFTADQLETGAVLSDSSLPPGSILNICQALYGVDLILHHTRTESGGIGKVGVQLLEIQMEPNTLVKCAIDEPLFANLAAGVWQIVTNGRPINNNIFEKVNF